MRGNAAINSFQKTNMSLTRDLALKLAYLFPFPVARPITKV